MSAVMIPAQYVRTGDKVWHSVAQKWCEVVEVSFLDAALRGWVRDGDMLRAYIPRKSRSDLILVRR